jgi:hypothetical protein
VQETASTVFDANPRTIHAWCARVEVPQGAAAKAASVAVHKPVRFCVVATGAAGTQIAVAARAVAAPNPVGRKVVVPGDPDYPDGTTIAG